MRESRTYGSGRGACNETHGPTATASPVHRCHRRRGSRVAARGARSRRRCDSLISESGMIRDTTDVKRRVMTQPLVVRNHKPLHGWFATALFLAGALASSGVAAAIGEQFFTMAGKIPRKAVTAPVISMPGAGFPRPFVRDPSATSAPAARPLLLPAA